jgi:hypothetical protein
VAIGDYILAFRMLKHLFLTFLAPASNLSREPFNRPAGTGLFSLMAPGTIMLSLRDKIQSPAEALLKLALMWLKPLADSYGPFGFDAETSEA